MKYTRKQVIQILETAGVGNPAEFLAAIQFCSKCKRIAKYEGITREFNRASVCEKHRDLLWPISFPGTTDVCNVQGCQRLAEHTVDDTNYNSYRVCTMHYKRLEGDYEQV